MVCTFNHDVHRFTTSGRMNALTVSIRDTQHDWPTVGLIQFQLTKHQQILQITKASEIICKSRCHSISNSINSSTCVLQKWLAIDYPVFVRERLKLFLPELKRSVISSRKYALPSTTIQITTHLTTNTDDDTVQQGGIRRGTTATQAAQTHVYTPRPRQAGRQPSVHTRQIPALEARVSTICCESRSALAVHQENSKQKLNDTSDLCLPACYHKLSIHTCNTDKIYGHFLGFP